MRSDGKDKNAVVSFTLTDEPQHIDLLKSDSKEEVSFRPSQELPLKRPVGHNTKMAKCQSNSPCFNCLKMKPKINSFFLQAVRLAVVCKDGQLHLFEHFLNG